MQLEFAVLSWDWSMRQLCDQLLSAAAMLDEVRDREHLDAVAVRELAELGQARHRAIGIHDLADYRGGIEARELAQVDGRFGLPGAAQDTALGVAQGQDVAGARKVAGLRIGVN